MLVENKSRHTTQLPHCIRFRPTEVDQLLGDPSKAKEKLGWKPKVTFEGLVKDMMEADIELMRKNPFA